MPRCVHIQQCVQEGSMAEIATPPDHHPPFVLLQGRLPDGQTTKIVLVPRGKGLHGRVVRRGADRSGR